MKTDWEENDIATTVQRERFSGLSNMYVCIDWKRKVKYISGLSNLFNNAIFV